MRKETEQDRAEHGMAAKTHTVAQPNDLITITLSAKDVAWWANLRAQNDRSAFYRMVEACRVATGWDDER